MDKYIELYSDGDTGEEFYAFSKTYREAEICYAGMDKVFEMPEDAPEVLWLRVSDKPFKEGVRVGIDIHGYFHDLDRGESHFIQHFVIKEFFRRTGLDRDIVFYVGVYY